MAAYVVIALVAVAVGIGVRIAVLSAFPEVDVKGPRDAARSRKRAAARTRMEAAADRAGNVIPVTSEREAASRVRLERAGLSMRTSTFRGCVAISALAFAALGVALAASVRADIPVRVLLAVVVTALGALTPLMLVSREGRKRAATIDAALPAALEMLAITVRSGCPLERGISLVGRRVDGPLGEELRRVGNEMGLLGMTLEQSLGLLADRTGSDRLRAFCRAVVQSSRQGTSVARVLDAQARLARNSYYADMLARVNALPNKMVPVIFVAFMPALVALPVVPSLATMLPTLFRLAGW